jgi:hypothetical protein
LNVWKTKLTLRRRKANRSWRDARVKSTPATRRLPSVDTSSADQIEQRRLARAGWPKDDDELGLINVKCDIIERGDGYLAYLIPLGDSIDGNPRPALADRFIDCWQGPAGYHGRHLNPGNSVVRHRFGRKFLCDTLSTQSVMTGTTSSGQRMCQDRDRMHGAIHLVRDNTRAAIRVN